MNLQRVILPILLATTVSVFASSSSTALDQEREQDKSATTTSKNPSNWVILGNLDPYKYSDQMRFIPKPGAVPLIEKIVFEKSRGSFILTLCLNSTLLDLAGDGHYQENLMHQLGTVEKSGFFWNWRLQPEGPQQQTISALVFAFFEFFNSRSPLDPDLFLKIGQYYGSPTKEALSWAREFIQPHNKPIVKWTALTRNDSISTFTPLGSQTIKRFSVTHSRELYTTSDEYNGDLIIIETFKPMKKLQKDACERSNDTSSRTKLLDRKISHALEFLMLCGDEDPKDFCIFKMPAEFINTQRNLDLFLKILGTLEPSVESELKTRLPNGSIENTDAPPYDITF